jgi:hypothetical protein
MKNAVEILKNRYLRPPKNKPYHGVTGHYGGTHIDDVPKPLIRAFDDRRRKRKITPNVITYVGLCWEAIHYYPSLREEDNPILFMDEYPPGHKQWLWVMCNGDTEGKGLVLDGPHDYTTEEDAWAWCKRTIKAEFPKHKLDFELHPGNRRKYQNA